MIVALVVVAAVGVRYGVVTDAGRSFVESILGGFKAGPYGRIHVEGLKGDIWRDFTVRELTIVDVHGTWLDARQLHVRWDWPQMLSRRLVVNEAQARLVTVIRRPAVEPAGPAGGRAPVSLHVDKLAAQMELMPAFSSRYGLYDVTGAIDSRREGGMAGKAHVASRTHPGDLADADFDLGRDKTIRLALTAQEANGGAMAGALGLAADQPFHVLANASGTISQGRFHVESQSGPLVPIAGDGAWNPQGGHADGKIVLAASKYLTWYQHWFGPDLRFQIDGAEAPDGLQNLTLTAASENIDIGARGEADLGRRTFGPQGLQVSILARQGQRFLGFPQMGAARMTGSLTGNLDRWTLAGPMEADGPTAFDYRLAQVRGPVKFEWGGGQLAIGAVADGAAGSGRGVVAALLGGRPHAAAQLIWLPDGRVLIKQLTVLGPGLKIDGQGDRGILGGLSFKGRATFSNFAVAQPGAKGLMTTSWSASQNGRSPWQFTFDAKAKGFASGMGELDHLLGPTPAMKGQGAFGPRASSSRRPTSAARPARRTPLASSATTAHSRSSSAGARAARSRSGRSRSPAPARAAARSPARWRTRGPTSRPTSPRSTCRS